MTQTDTPQIKLIPDEPHLEIGTTTFEGNCTLDRADDAKRLSDLVSGIQTPMVVAVDGPWGCGKSHFLKLWCGEHHHVNGGTPNVIYFDAFEHDYLGEPLTALLGAIGDRLGAERSTMEKIWNARSKIVPVAASAATHIAKAGLAAFVGRNATDEVIEAMSQETIGLAADGAGALLRKEEEGRIEGIKAFKEALASLSKENQLIIVIDELDRCRPDFALSLLEITKHLFHQDNVHFVLGVNLAELENTVRARYGAGVDARRYLRKFITVVFGLVADPELTRQQAIKFARWQAQRMHLPQSWAVDHLLLMQLESLPDNNVPSLRDLQYILRRMTLTGILKIERQAYVIIACGLLMLEQIKPDVFEKTISGSVDWEDIESSFGFTRTWKTMASLTSMNDEEKIAKIWAHAINPVATTKSELGRAFGGLENPLQYVIAKYLHHTQPL